MDFLHRGKKPVAKIFTLMNDPTSCSYSKADEILSAGAHRFFPPTIENIQLIKDPGCSRGIEKHQFKLIPACSDKRT
jgi:hypothetical protein